jgi:hypothetical protein
MFFYPLPIPKTGNLICFIEQSRTRNIDDPKQRLLGQGWATAASGREVRKRMNYPLPSTDLAPK